MKWIYIALVLLIVGVILGWGYHVYKFNERVIIKIATTTSLHVTGLLDYLAAEFSKKYQNIGLNFIAVGTGQALRLAEKGDVCGVIVHDPIIEKLYIDKNVIANRTIFAYNFFVVVGPKTDLANVSKANSLEEVFKRIGNAGDLGKAVFISRGDDSGTHLRELLMWRRADVNIANKTWYLSCGCNMGQALIIANEKKAYTLSDIATFIVFKNAGRLPNLDVLYMNISDSYTINIYSGYVSRKCSDVEKRYMIKFLEFVYENRETLISNYSLGIKDEQKMFYPIVNCEEEIKKLWEFFAERAKM